MTTLSPAPVFKAFDNNGAPLAGGKLFTYKAGTSVKLASYQDSAGTPNTNPVILNSRGECALWIPANTSYKYVLSPSTDTDPPTAPIWTVDNVMNNNIITLYGGVDGGVANAYTLAFTASFSAYTDGIVIYFWPANTNTGASTLNVNGLGVVPIVNLDGTALTASEIIVNQPAGVMYKGGSFYLLTWTSMYTPGFTGSVTRTVKAKLQESVSVLDFGAAADGSTDDTTAWIAAIAAMPVAGGWLKLPAGKTSLISANLVWKSNLFLTLEAGSSLKLKSGSATGIRIIDARGNISNIGFYGPGCIDGNLAGQSAGNKAHGIGVCASNVIIRDLEVKNIQCNAGSMGDGIILETDTGSGFETNNVLITGCHVHDGQRQGITLESGKNIKIIGNLIENQIGPGSAIDLEPNSATHGIIDGVVIANNSFKNCSTGAAINSSLASVTLQNIVVSDNTVDTVTNGYVLRGCKRVTLLGGRSVNVSGNGIFVYSDAVNQVSDVLVKGHVINGAGARMVYVQSTTNAADIANVTFEGCETTGSTTAGFVVTKGTNIRFIGCKATFASGTSFGVDTITGYEISDCYSNGYVGGTNGFETSSCTNVIAGGNTAIGGTYGFYIHGCTNVVWKGGDDFRRCTNPMDVATTTNWYGTFTGTFTMGNATQINVNNVFVDAKSMISFIPTNASGATLQAGATALYSNPAGMSNNVSLRVATSNGGTAAGTETFQYIVTNPMY